ncbi:hypothetical protein M9H77_15756 [Catharanthus roseus]|uniref:Uncharacterized protein n=1 Tax=Catharanthus roseus TaxID=4058 RepID=A0ACC0B136_CATRO|nr:hypothetical protein M9H77_15756 [Catharanthus roseus]
MSSSNSPCAACKCLRRKCTPECVFAPYFPPDQPQKFINVHKVFGASNVAKLLNDLNASQREDAVNSLAYEAEYRLRDPVYGCVGLISVLQHRLKQIQYDLYSAKTELASYIGPSAMLPILQPGFVQQQHPNNPSSSAVLPYHMQPMMALQTGMASAHGGQLVIRDPQQQQQHQQMLEAQQMAAAAAAREQEMLRAYQQQQHQQQQALQPPVQQDLLRFNSGFDTGDASTATAYDQMPADAGMPPSLALGPYETVPYHQLQQQQPSEHSHSHPHPHAPEHSHSHPHLHLHLHSSEHSHSNPHPHPHLHASEHSHSYPHLHLQSSEHSHSDPHPHLHLHSSEHSHPDPHLQLHSEHSHSDPHLHLQGHPEPQPQPQPQPQAQPHQLQFQTQILFQHQPQQQQHHPPLQLLQPPDTTP